MSLCCRDHLHQKEQSKLFVQSAFHRFVRSDINRVIQQSAASVGSSIVMAIVICCEHKMVQEAVQHKIVL
jgi:hypothetical protein